MNYTKIAIIGAGNVGSTIAYTCMLQNITAEIILVDSNDTFCEGQVIDLCDILAFSKTSRVIHGSYKDASQADIIIISAGAKQQPNQARTDLISINKKVIASIFNQMGSIKKGSIVIMVTNPLDILTLHAQTISNHPRHLIFGTGTFLDTQRLRGCIAQKAGVAPESTHAYVLGEHGDSEFAAWSTAHIAGNPLSYYKELTPAVLNAIEQETRNKAYDIIAKKGATYFGIGACVATLCKSIIFDEKEIFPLSSYHSTYNICFSLPAMLGINGIEKIFEIQLNDQEQKSLEASVAKIKNDLKAI